MQRIRRRCGKDSDGGPSQKAAEGPVVHEPRHIERAHPITPPPPSIVTRTHLVVSLVVPLQDQSKCDFCNCVFLRGCRSRRCQETFPIFARCDGQGRTGIILAFVIDWDITMA